MTAFFRKMPPLSVAMLLFFGGAVCASLLSYDWHLSIPFLLTLIVGIILYFGLSAWLTTAQRLSYAGAVLVLIASLFAVIFVIQYRSIGWNAKLDIFTQLGILLSAPFPQLINPGLTANAGATLLECCLPLAFGLAYDSHGWRRIFWLATAFLLGFVIMLSASRGAWFAVASVGILGIIGFIWRYRQHLTPRIRIHVGARPPLAFYANQLSRRAIIACLALGLLGLVLTNLPPLLSSDLRMRAVDRLGLYRDSFYLALQFPITGIGSGTFAYMYSHFQLLIQVPYLEYAHNLWLSVWLSHGLLGLLGFLGMILASLRLVWRVLPELGGLGFGAALGNLALLLHGLTDASQYDATWAVLPMAFALFGLMIASTRLINNQSLRWINVIRSEIYQSDRGGVYRPQRWSRMGLACIVAYILGVLIYLPGILALAASNSAAIMHARAHLAPDLSPEQRIQRLAQADSWLDKAHWLMPGSPAVLREHGILSFERGNYAEAIWLLTRAAPAYPDDQGLLKSLGLAYTWYGYTEEGAAILATLSHADEVREELGTWVVAWEQRGQRQYAINSRIVAERLAGR